MTSWKITGFIATIIIALSLPLYILKTTYFGPASDQQHNLTIASFVGHKKCIECHKQEYDKWQKSHHFKAMEVATDKSVLGDFNDSVFEHQGITSRFYRKNNKFFVRTPGPKGDMGDYEITHTFGYYPLQQYLVPFPGGRLQCLPIAWDARQRNWFHLYPYDTIDPAEWIYWTNAGQNWNGMCSECHSTNLKKNYNMDSDTFQTTWSEINVSCEACHGPGSLHVRWAEVPEMARSRTEKNFGLVVQTRSISSRAQVELCAPCHSRRRSLGEYRHDQANLLDILVPQLLRQDMYFPDGQILEEVYVYGSFIQSKMFDRDVRCSDCHDVHSITLIKEGNNLCLQCHRADIYDTKDHHFHKKEGEKGEPLKSPDGKIISAVGEGAQCVKCHMPGRNYMVIDYRPDHSLRVPRPDLSQSLDTPNACNQCHTDKTNRWSVEHVTKWYGLKRKPHYGSVLEAGRRRSPNAQADLIKIAGDALYPVIVRATAVSLLGAYPGTDSLQALEIALADEDPLIRLTAILSLPPIEPKRFIKLISPALYDPVKAVRIEAANSLTRIPTTELTADIAKLYQGVLSEYRKTLRYSADFAYARYNLGNMYLNLKQLPEAEKNYNAAIQIDRDFYPAKVNLAMLYNQMGQNSKAERLLRQVVTSNPELYEVNYSLGLLLAETKQYVEATRYLEQAARGIPNRARVHYNLGLLLDYLRRDADAERALSRALEIEPHNVDYLVAVAEYYLKRKELHKAKPIAEQLIESHSSNTIGYELLDLINKQLRARNSTD
ncbi:MAG: multiheme c-type cytochrome [Desulfobacterales bacterium]|jgi:Tfp pilus assembly protein PilF